MPINVIKVVLPSVLTFFLGILITPFFTNFFYKYKMWKKNPRTETGDITSDDFTRIHNTKGELSTPRVGGIIIWVSVLLTVAIIFLVSKIFPTNLTEKLNFFSRSQTLIPLADFILAALIGLVDDTLQIIGKGSYAKDSIVYRRVKIGAIIAIGLAISSWFYFKLNMTMIHIPFWYDVNLGWMFIPFFIIIMLAVFSTSVIDGLDGLSGGVFASIFASYAIIAFTQTQYNLSALCATCVGGILAFLWFNIPPARFYMSETGTMGLTLSIASIAFLTDAHAGCMGILVLPIIGGLLVITVASNIVQIGSKKICKRKLFRVAPIHHHFEAIGWPSYKVTMRYWILSIIFAFVGVICALVFV